ncbi:tripartite tricarboxylate transporter substrate-binding protein [Afipia carboxidovorans]|nr:tripartite tricarboxylate transporter substrate-binding protein [Afipia carboxidovorans]
MLAGTAVAQDYPTRPITMIVPFAAGGPSDAIGRLVAQSMSKSLGQQVVVESVSGAGGTVGASRLARSDADGYTILIHHVALAAGASLYKNLDYDTSTAFAPIGLVNRGPMVLLSRKNYEASDAKALLGIMREQGTKVSVGHAGVGSNSHLCTLLMQEALNSKFTLVAYKGTGPAMNDLMGGQLDILCDQSTTAIPQISGKMIKGYAVTSAERLDALKDLPTLQEAGLKDFNFTIWHGLYAPAKTPEPIVKKLNEALQAALSDQSVLQRFAEVGTSPFPADQRTPAAHKKQFDHEIAVWKDVIGKNKK